MNAKQMTVRAMLAIDDWGPVQEVSTSATRINALQLKPEYAQCYGNISSLRVDEHQSEAALTIGWPRNHDDVAAHEVWAVDKDGRRHEVNGTAGGREFSFRLPLSQIARFEYRLRPYRHWVTFENVSLQPGRQTDVKVTTVSLPPPRPDKYIAELPEGVSVEFVGLAEMGKEDRNWWKPDGSPLIPVPAHKFDGSVEISGQEVRRALIRVHGAKSLLDVTTNMTGTRADEATGSGGPFVSFDGALGVEPGKPTARVEVGVATQPLSPVRKLDASGKRLPRDADAPVDPISEDITVVSVAHPRLRASSPRKVNGKAVPLTPDEIAEDDKRRTQTEITWLPPQPRNRWEFHLTLIDLDGKTHRRQTQTYYFDKPDVSHTFDLPLAQVARFEYRLRPYRHWVTFENVSVEPGKQTELNVKVESLPDEKPRAGRGSADPALDPTAGLPNSDEETNPPNNANGDLRSNPAAAGDPRPAQLARIVSLKASDRPRELAEVLKEVCRQAEIEFEIDDVELQKDRYLQSMPMIVEEESVRGPLGFVLSQVLNPVLAFELVDQKLRVSTRQKLKGSRFDADHIDLAKLAETAGPTLTSLRFCGTRVTDDDLRHLAKFPKLERLDLTSTAISDAGIEHVARLESLSTLRLGEFVTDAGLKTLTASRSIRTLALLQSPVTDAAAESLVKMPSLETLTIQWANFGDAGAKRLAAADRLKHLVLYVRTLTDEGADALASCQKLETLSLLGARLTVGSLKPLEKMRSLRELEIGFPEVTDSDVKPLRTALAKTRIRQSRIAPPDASSADGHVFDADTGRILETFRSQFGHPDPVTSEIEWEPLREQYLAPNVTGSFGVSRLQPFRKFRVIADGYEPVEITSRLLPGDDPQNHEMKIQMRRATKKVAETKPPDGLEFLKPYPKLHGLSLDMTEPQFLEIVKQQELTTRKTVDDEKVTHHIALGDGHTLIVMFDKDAKCSGIQRVRGEETSPGGLLSRMIERPSVELLRELLATAKTQQPEPVELLDDGRRGREKKGSRVVVANNGRDRFAIVTARVRPVTELSAFLRDDDRRVECAFVFDWQGRLIATLGGQIRIVRGTSVSIDAIDVVRLGPEEDWFVRVMKSRDDEPLFEQWEYYRIANPVISSLRYFHYPNSNAWSFGPEERTSRFGYLSFDFPTVSDKFKPHETGSTVDGVPVNREILWDGDRNLFVGAPAQRAKNKPLYQVDNDWSKEFEPLTPKRDQLVVTGGLDERKDRQHACHWSAVVPDGFEAVVTLTIPQRNGPPNVVERRIGPALAHLTVESEPQESEATTRVRLWISGKEETFDMPFELGNSPEPQPIIRLMNPGNSAPLLSRPLKSSPEPLRFEIKLLAKEPKAAVGNPNGSANEARQKPVVDQSPDAQGATHEGVIEAVADKAIVFEDGKLITTDAATKYARLTDKGEVPAERKELKAGVRVRYELVPGKGATKVVLLPDKKDGEQPKDAPRGEAKEGPQVEKRVTQEEVFARRVSLDAKEMPLRKALATLARAANVELLLEEDALKQAHVDLEKPVTVTIDDEPLGEALIQLIPFNPENGVIRSLRGGKLVLTSITAYFEHDRVTTLRVLPEWLKPVYGKGLLVTLGDDNQIVTVTAGDGMTDELLSQLKTLPKLRELTIDHTTKITADGLAHLAELTGLEKLSLSSINTTGEGLADEALKHIVGLKSLRELNLNECGTTDAGIRMLEGMPQLTQLDVYQEGRLTDAAIASIAKLKQLKHLRLASYVGTERWGFMRFSAESLRQLSALQELEILALPGQTVPADFFLEFPRLTALDLQGPFVTDATAERIAQRRTLRSLSLSGSQITDKGWKRIATLPELRRLSLRREQITDEGVGHLRGLTKLEHLEMRTGSLTNEALGHLAEIQSLTRLDLWGGGSTFGGGGSDFTVVGLQQLKGLPKLRTLWLNNFENAGGYGGLKELKQLRELVFEMVNINQQEFNDLETALPKTSLSGGFGWGHLRSIRRPNGF